MAKWRENECFGNHLCLCHQQRDFGGSHFPDDKNRNVPPNFGLLAIEPTDANTSQTILMCQIYFQILKPTTFLNLFIRCLYVAKLLKLTSV